MVAQPSTDSLPRNVVKYTNYKHDGRAVPFVVKNGGLQFMSGYSWFAKNRTFISVLAISVQIDKIIFMPPPTIGIRGGIMFSRLSCGCPSVC